MDQLIAVILAKTAEERQQLWDALATVSKTPDLEVITTFLKNNCSTLDGKPILQLQND